MTNLPSKNSKKAHGLNTPYSPLNLIKAGAGAGKTYHIQKTLTEWVKSGEVSADRILAVTFTNAAANELKERIRLALLQAGLHKESTKVQQSKISTIHGFGLELLERFAYEKGSSPSPRQLTEAEQNVLIRLSLTKVEQIIPILDDLAGWGYKDEFNGNEYKEAVVKFKDRVLDIIGSLRNIGTDDSDGSRLLIKHAKNRVKDIYGKKLSKASTLNKALWLAVKAVQDKYAGGEGELALEDAWASNTDSRLFVQAIYKASEKEFESNWMLWTALQSIDTAPKIFIKKSGEPKHEDATMAYAIWDAADKLSVHPGPLEQSLAHIEILLKSALETLNHYQSLKKQGGLVDFGDMVHLAEQLMKDDAWLNEIKSNFDCLIIDEFQDTNPLQFSLLWCIAKAGIPALIVGDVKQSIMGFQGADSRLFNTLVDQNRTHSAELTSNWRSTAGLMAFINKLGKRLYKDEYTELTPKSDIKSTLKPVKIIRFSEEFWSARGSVPKNLYSFSAEHDGVVVAEIKKILGSDLQVTDKITGQKRAVRPNDIAVLGPSHKGLANFADKLKYFGIQPQLKQSGWFESDSVSWVRYALSYLADPRDQHALMCLNLIMDQQTDLQTALINYLQQDKPRKVTSKAANDLNAVKRQGKYASVSETVRKTIEALSLWDRFARDNSDDYGQQQRANLLKLIKLTETFENTQSETLQAQGIFGVGLSSFLVWLQANSDDIDTQPHIDGNNQNAVVLSTWHASKGLEWPIVVVIGMDKVREPKLPAISVQYNDTQNVDVMLDKAYTQILTNFDDKKTNKKFIENLVPAEKDTLKNLTYVVMTRAREQLILPWFDPQKANCMIALLSESDIKNPEMINAKIPKDPIQKKTQQSKAINYGRVAVDYKELPEIVLAQLSPSTLVKSQQHDEDSRFDVSKLSTLNYHSAIDFSVLDTGNQANDIGTWVHQIYEVILSKPSLEERLFKSLTEINEFPELRQQLVDHVYGFQASLVSHLKSIDLKSEVPILAKTDNGATLSGIIDLLVETEKGYWIIDHKTDSKMSDEQFKKHLPQLLAYAEHTNLNKPILGVAINWVRGGKISCLSF